MSSKTGEVCKSRRNLRIPRKLRGHPVGQREQPKSWLPFILGMLPTMIATLLRLFVEVWHERADGRLECGGTQSHAEEAYPGEQKHVDGTYEREEPAAHERGKEEEV